MLQSWYDDVVIFCQWLDDNLGPRPKGYTLDRINNNEGYYPGNLRWASRSQQMLNRDTFANNQVGYKYVSAYRGGYRGRFRYAGVCHSTGRFDTPAQAYYNTLALRLEVYPWPS